MRKYQLAIVGPRGAVGGEMLKVLEQRKFPIDGNPKLLVATPSGDRALAFKGKKISVEDLHAGAEQFQDIDLVLISSDRSVSKRYAPMAVKAGAVVIDNTSAYRLDPTVPLVIPEINSEDIQNHKGIIANPNCTAAIMLMAIAPLHQKNRIKRVICATYQSASGAGRRAMEELKNQTLDYLDGNQVKKSAFLHQIAFNLFSHDSPILDDGHNEEEFKVIQESKKILHDNKIQIGITCIRVPILRAHSEAIYLEFERKMTPSQARQILEQAPGVKVVDDHKTNHFPMPIEASGQDDVLVGRIRQDKSIKNGLALFVSGDQLRKGAALNAVQIAERFIHLS